MKKRIGPMLVLLALASVTVFLKAPSFARVRSLMLMKIYDRFQENFSVQEDIGFSAEFPLEKMKLFPMMITYNGTDISEHLGQPVKFSVEYSFADYADGKSHSRFYDPEDDLYNAYIGSYSISGFKKQLDRSDLKIVTAYDMEHLALPAVGLSASDSTFEILHSEKDPDNLMISGYNFVIYKSSLITNGPEHTPDDFAPGDLLYGSSPEPSSSYPLREMAGRIYLHYFAEKDLNLAFFTIAKSEEILDQFEEKIISNISINFR